MLTFHTIGDWPEAEVHAMFTDADLRRSVPAVEALIDAAWQDALARPCILLFDGPMCRLDRWQADERGLSLSLSRTSYRAFLGTNLSHPELVERWHPEVMANPVGVSVALEASDGPLLLGRRTETVAYYPSRVHPFAGALEPRDAGRVFDAVRRELQEELALGAGDVGQIWCAGIVEDWALRQPELIFRVTSSRTRAQVELSLDRGEHHAVHAVEPNPRDVAVVLADRSLTPVAVATVLLWGRARFGDGWFDASVESMGLTRAAAQHR